MSSKEELMRKKKYAVAQLPEFGGVCWFCGKKFGRGFLFDHLEYVFGEKIYSDFKNTIDYNLYILPRVIKDPGRFLLSCSKHHTMVTRLRRCGRKLLIKLILGVYLTDKTLISNKTKL